VMTATNGAQQPEISISFYDSYTLAPPSLTSQPPNPGNASRPPGAELMHTVMNKFYGTFNQKSACWISRRADTTYCMKPYKLDEVGSDKNHRFFVVVAGQTLGDDGSPMEFHAATGILGLIVLAENGGQPQVTAKSLYETSESYGRVPTPESFAVRELGPGGAYGWEIKYDEFHSGVRYDVTQLYGVVGDTVALIGSIPSEYQENEASGCVPTKCSNYSIKIVTDATVRNVPFYPLVLRAAGFKDGRPFNKTYRVPFDQLSLSYLVPRELQ
jgi:hypothetical protein